MLPFDSMPQARVVRKGGHALPQPPVPPHHEPTPVRDHLRALLAVAVGMWPLTTVVLLAFGLLWMAAFNIAP